ncbi:hypothetical protein FIBSPDRAFT_1036716 [Athelia psychrophila]|uniref:Uncharacterized protein n=1 Tax=Athelia psychrophila TaxID=1759441 RepID=A0A166VC19_9AGAM|nr:hypothetical protein FIBSPDRAFT_1036716 [Fibularhizoctonia sp. CBS 109695]
MHANSVCLWCGAGTMAETYNIEPSAVHDLLHSNLPPDPKAQMNAARKSVHDLFRDLDHMDKEISQIKVVLRRLQSKRVALQDYAQAHKALISSFRQFPAEILSEIFIHALPPPHLRLSKLHAPLLLQGVCRRWRDVVQSTPAVWSYIYLDFDRRNYSDDDRCFEFLSTCLSRSGQYPLSISLKARMWPPAQSGDRVLALLTAQCERWHTVHLQGQSSMLSQLSKVKGRLSSLHSVHLNPSSWAEPMPLLDTFAVAQKLRHFAGYLHTELMLPWNSLTSLAISQRTAKALWTILQNCPNLVEFEGRIPEDIWKEENVSECPHVRLPYLRSLSLTLQRTWTQAILSTLTVPVLEYAHLIIARQLPTPGFKYKRFHVCSGLSVLLSQSKCTLLKFKLEGEKRALDPLDIMGCLEALPSLTELDLDAAMSRLLPLTRFMDRPDGAATPLVPGLRKLQLNLDKKFPWDRFQTFLESRRVVGGWLELLQSLILTVHDDMPTYQDALDTLESEGIDGTHGGVCVHWA